MIFIPFNISQRKDPIIIIHLYLPAANHLYLPAANHLSPSSSESSLPSSSESSLPSSSESSLTFQQRIISTFQQRIGNRILPCCHLVPMRLRCCHLVPMGLRHKFKWDHAEDHHDSHHQHLIPSHIDGKGDDQRRRKRANLSKSLNRPGPNGLDLKGKRFSLNHHDHEVTHA